MGLAQGGRLFHSKKMSCLDQPSTSIAGKILDLKRGTPFERHHRHPPSVAESSVVLPPRRSSYDPSNVQL